MIRHSLIPVNQLWDVPSNYNVNMIEEEHKNVSEYRDRDNIKFPYITSKYLCDVCHIQIKDLRYYERFIYKRCDVILLL